MRMHLEKGEKMEKFPVGPTRQKPGPTLFNVVATAEKLVVKSRLSTLINKNESSMIAKYVAANTLVERTTS